MGEKMLTLEQVRDWHLSKAAFYCDEEYPRMQQRHKRMADAITAHLTQPAHGCVHDWAVGYGVPAYCNHCGVERDPKPVQAVDDDKLLEVARRVGLRQQFTGVNAEDAKFLLRAFVDAIAALPKDSNGAEGVGR